MLGATCTDRGFQHFLPPSVPAGCGGENPVALGEGEYCVPPPRCAGDAFPEVFLEGAAAPGALPDGVKLEAVELEGHTVNFLNAKLIPTGEILDLTEDIMANYDFFSEGPGYDAL